MIVWLVDEERFINEYMNHIGTISSKYVNWTVDPRTGYLWMYIVALHSPEVYCYIHKQNPNELPAQLRTMISKRGEVLGTLELENINSMKENITKFGNEVKKLKFSQVNPNDKP